MKGTATLVGSQKPFHTSDLDASVLFTPPVTPPKASWVYESPVSEQKCVFVSCVFSWGRDPRLFNRFPE